MLLPAAHLLVSLLLIGTRDPVPSAQAPPQGCYMAEEAGERTFRCSQAGLSAVPPGIPNDTRKLYLDANQLVSVPAGAFQHLSILEELDLSHNVLVHLSGAAFQGLAGTLRHLDLSANQLASVPAEAFQGLQIQVNLSANPWHCDCALQEALRQLVKGSWAETGDQAGGEVRQLGCSHLEKGLKVPSTPPRLLGPPLMSRGPLSCGLYWEPWLGVPYFLSPCPILLAIPAYPEGFPKLIPFL